METKHSSPPEIRSSPFTISETVKLSVKPLDPEELRKMDAYWRAANYLSVGQIYLFANPLLREPLKLEHIKPRLLGHWGTTPGPEFHLRPFQPPDQEARPERDLHRRSRPRRPGAGGQHLSRRHLLARSIPTSRRTKRACGACSSSFPFPAAFPATSRPETPGSIHEGGELGYSLAARLRRGVRQSRSAGLLRGRRRRSGNRPAGRELALEQISQSGARRRRASHPASERLQDRQSHGARPHRPTRT